MANVKSITPLPPADFTPELGNYKTLQPFKYWCQKVLPLVYDDSLSYYELLCKVVDYLNKTMEDVETLQGDVTNLHVAYDELQSYVNNYFSTLDVQEEINNKLDELASSGRLDVLLYTYIPYITPEMFGAKGDGITDDTKSIQDALNVPGASIYFKGNSKYLITSEITIPSTLRLIEFNYCTIISKSITYAFIAKVSAEDSLYLTLKNCNVNLRSCGFIKFIESYFTTLENIRITGADNNAICVHYENGFNDTIKGCLFQGKNVEVKSCIGVKYECTTPIHATYDQFTNCIIKDSLIQYMHYGVLYRGSINTNRFDSNQIINTGFSRCDTAIISDISNGAQFFNNMFSNIRCELSDTFMSINGYTIISDIYVYNTKYGLKQLDTNLITLRGILYYYGNTIPFSSNVNNVDLSCASPQYLIRNEIGGIAEFEEAKFNPPNRTNISKSISSLSNNKETIYIITDEEYIDLRNFKPSLKKYKGSIITFFNKKESTVNLTDAVMTVTLQAYAQILKNGVSFMYQNDEFIWFSR